jgi:hypothetical protein
VASDGQPRDVETSPAQEKQAAADATCRPEHDARDEDRMDDLGYGQSQDREMHTRRSDADRAEDGRGASCRHDPGQQVRLQGVDVQPCVEKSARISAEAEIGRMPEGHEPGGAQK